MWVNGSNNTLERSRMPASDQVRAVVVDNKNPGKLVIAPAPIQPRGPNDVTVKADGDLAQSR